ncbi:MAG: collagen binding domain-containing protein, partial [Eubacteriales bacterium]|nr:collagen binding domain-containing protein [Eubacteriales bacterium]
MTKKISLLLSVCLLLQIVLPAVALAAATPNDLTGKTQYLVMHDTTGTYPAYQGGPSSLTVKRPDGTPIPLIGNTYSDVPSGSSFELNYVFHLEDGDGISNVYDYSGSNYFDITLPEGITFTPPAGENAKVYAIDKSVRWHLGNWEFIGPNTVRVQLTPEAAEHRRMWGEIGIQGTFDETSAGDDDEVSMLLGTQNVTFVRVIPPPPSINVAKTGVYNAASNTITWTITVDPPEGISLAGYKLEDVYSANQTYKAGTFYKGVGEGATNIPDANLDLTQLRKIIYEILAGATGQQVFTYQTTPDSFANETGMGGAAYEYSRFTNTATLKLGDDPAADPVKADVDINWTSKSGSLVTTTDGSVVMKWEVSVIVPPGSAITGTCITDTLPAGLKLIEASPRLPQVSFAGGTAQNVSSGTGAGTYTYTYTGSTASSQLVYRFPAVDGVDGKLSGTAKFVYFTEVTDRTAYLNNNGSVNFTNSAQLNWAEMPGTTPPKDTASAGITGGGLISKSGGSTVNYVHPGIIQWTVTVNRNKIAMSAVTILDSVPVGQELLIGSDNPLTIQGPGAPVVITSVEPPLPTALSSEDAFTRKFAYVLGDITDTYTLRYYTRIIDTNPDANNDASGLDTLYVNGQVSFQNGVTLRRGTQDLPIEGTKTYNSQVIQKTVLEHYNHNTHVAKWSIVVNRNRLPLTTASVRDVLPAGMVLLIDDDHAFAVTKRGVATPVATAPTTGVNGSTEFVYAFGSINDEHTITFYTQMTDTALLGQWDGEHDFTNRAILEADQLPLDIESTAKTQVINPIVSKRAAYTAGADYIQWSVVINAGQVPLCEAEVEDRLDTGLVLDSASLKLYEVPVAADGTVGQASAGTLVTTGYTVGEPTAANKNTLSVQLPEGSRSAYRLEFATFIVVNNLDFTNEVTLTGTTQSPGG